MELDLLVRNESGRKGLYRSDNLKRIGRKVCEGEGIAKKAELSLLFCDDGFIRELNRQYRAKNEPTDVLSFGQLTEVGEAPGQKELVLGDIVISLETVERRATDTKEMRDEVRLLFCHGLLHLLGYTHDTPAGKKVMQAKQALYLNVRTGQAWPECAPSAGRETGAR